MPLNKSKNVINYIKLRNEIKKFAYKQDNSEKLLNILLQSFSKKQFFSSLFEVCYPEYHYAITKDLPLFVELIDTLLMCILSKIPPNGQNSSKSHSTSTVIKEYATLFSCCTSINIDPQINRIVKILKILPNKNNCDICLIREQCKINIIKNRLDKWFNLIYLIHKEELIMNYNILKPGKLYDDADRIIYAGCKCSYQDSCTETNFLIAAEIGALSDDALTVDINKSKDVA